MAERIRQEQGAAAPRYRTKALFFRRGVWILPGSLIEPTARELAAFGDRLELIPAIEQLELERARVLTAKQAALDVEKSTPLIQ